VQQPPEFHPEGDVFVHTCLVLDQLGACHPALGWGALLHDVGKPPTFEVAERIRFDRHVPVGTEMAQAILDRLRCDRETTRRAVELVHQHLRFRDVERMRPATLKRFLRQDHFEDHLRLHRADCLASHGGLGLYEFCRAQLEELGQEQLRPSPLLNGHDLLALGYPAGPLIGSILRRVEDEQLEGRLSDRRSALAFVETEWPLDARRGEADRS
jgi:poly(A) polymerase